MGAWAFQVVLHLPATLVELELKLNWSNVQRSVLSKIPRIANRLPQFFFVPDCGYGIHDWLFISFHHTTCSRHWSYPVTSSDHPTVERWAKSRATCSSRPWMSVDQDLSHDFEVGWSKWSLEKMKFFRLQALQVTRSIYKWDILLDLGIHWHMYWDLLGFGKKAQLWNFSRDHPSRISVASQPKARWTEETFGRACELPRHLKL